MMRALSVTLVLASAGIIAARAETSKPSAPPPRAAMTDLRDRDIQIAVWKKALAQDPISAIALGQLAGLYMQRGRESGDETNYRVAEQYARRSVEMRASRNGAAFVTLASALLAQHEFI